MIEIASAAIFFGKFPVSTSQGSDTRPSRILGRSHGALSHIILTPQPTLVSVTEDFQKNKGGGQKCSGLFYVPALTSMPLFLSGMMEAVYCFTEERFTEETLRNTEMED